MRVHTRWGGMKIYTCFGMQESQSYASCTNMLTENRVTVGVGGSSHAQSHRLHIARVPIASIAAARHAVANTYTS